MDKKTLVTTAATTAVAVLVTGLIGWMTGVWSQGSEAVARDQIETIAKEVIVAEMEMDTGMTQAEALVKISEALGRIETTVNVNREDIRDIRTAVTALASD
jgi:hypothetical protein